MSSEKSIVEQIKHYQRDIIKSPSDSKRMIRCIERLNVLPVTIAHLQETGVGRSVNDLRKCGGEVGAAAHALVCKWKTLVKVEDEDSSHESDAEESTSVINKKNGLPVNDKKNGLSHKKDVQKDHRSNKKDESRKSSSSHSSHNKHKSSNQERRSSKDSDKISLQKSGHKPYREMSDKTTNSSSSNIRHSSSSHRSKNDTDSKLNNTSNLGSKHEKSSSKHSVSKTNHSKSSSIKENKSNTSKHNSYEKENRNKEENLHRSSSSKKYNVNSFDSESSDDDVMYKPKPSTRKRKNSDSDEDNKLKYKKSIKKSLEKESSSKRKHYDDSSEESEVRNDCDEISSDNDSARKSDSLNSPDIEEISNRSKAEDNTSDNESDSDSRNSAAVSNDYGRSNNETSSESEKEEEYVPVKIKKEKESPPRQTKSYSSQSRSQSNHDKNTHTSRDKSSSKSSKLYSATIKVEKEEEVNIKKEKSEKDSTNSHKFKESRSSSDKKEQKSKSSREQQSKHSNDAKRVKVKIEKEEDGSIDCESGASFADALMGLSDSKKKSIKKKTSTPTPEKTTKVDEKYKHHKSSNKQEPQASSSSMRSTSSSPSSLFKEPDLLSKHIKLEPLDVDLKSTLPEITPNYKPLPHYSPPGSPANKKAKLMSQEDALSTIMSTKNQRTKVYSGNKTGFTKVPSLFELCIQVLRENIEALEYTGGVPYDLLKPVLDRATADQLFQLEHYNPYLVEDTDPLWQFHCNKDFRGKKPEEFETWRELYLRLLDEREQKLKALKENITQSMAKSTPIRQTKLAYVDSVVKPPRNIARKQMKYGTSKAVKHEIVAKAMVGAASSSPAPEVTSVPAPSRASSSNAFPIPNFLKKKKAPLMAKALQLIKGNRFKR